MMMMVTALRKSRVLIELMGQYEIRFADEDNGDDGNGDDDPMVTARDEDEGTRKSRGQIQLIVDGLLTLMENDDGQWN